MIHQPVLVLPTSHTGHHTPLVRGTTDSLICLLYLYFSAAIDLPGDLLWVGESFEDALSILYYVRPLECEVRLCARMLVEDRVLVDVDIRDAARIEIRGVVPRSPHLCMWTVSTKSFWAALPVPVDHAEAIEPFHQPVLDIATLLSINEGGQARYSRCDG